MDASEKIPRTKEISLCPCKSTLAYQSCCMPFHYGRGKPDTAEKLMRSRYSAYFFRLVDYLLDTTHPDTRGAKLRDELNDTVHEANWSFLTIVGCSKGGPEDKMGKVHFIATYYVDNEQFELEEVSRFRRYKGAWKYLDDKG